VAQELLAMAEEESGADDDGSSGKKDK